MKRPLAIVASVTVLLSVTLPVLAASQPRAISSSAAADVLDDIYLAGEDITLNREAMGDAVVAGGNVYIRQSVAGDLMTAGGNVDVSADIADDARIAGGMVTINAKIGDDLVVAGGTVKVLADSVVEGNVHAFGGTVDIDGIVNGTVDMRGGRVALNGTVDKAITLYGEDVVVNGTVNGDARLVGEKIHIGPNASFKGKVEYWNEEGTVDFGTSVATGTAVFNESLRDDAHMRGGDGKMMAGAGAAAALLGIWSILGLLSSALLIFLFMLIPGNLFTRAANRVRKEPWFSLLVGVVYFVMVPVALIALAITIIGLPLALFGAAAYFFVLYAASTLTAMVAARWVETYYGKHWSKAVFFFASIGLLFALKLLWFIPIVGWIVGCVLKVMAIGALLLAKHDWWKSVSKVK